VKKPILIVVFLSLIVVAAIALMARLKVNAPANAGPVVENFASLDEGGNFFELYSVDPKKTKAIVLITHGLGCPIVQKNFPTVEQLNEKYGPLGIRFLFVNSNPQDAREKIAQDAKAFQIKIPILLDQSQIISDALKFTRTAEAAVIETSHWNLLYQGAIDDRLDYNYQKFAASKNYLENALESFLKNRPIEVAQSKGIGCAISSYSWPETITYNKDIAPIVSSKCMFCHQENGSPPTNLNTYESLRGWAPMVREVIKTRRMPLWEPDSFYVKYASDQSLSDREMGLLVKWVNTGAQEGPKIEVAQKPAEPEMIQYDKPFHADKTYGPIDTVIPANTEKPWQYDFLGRAEKDMWITGQRLTASYPGGLQHVALIATSRPMDIESGEFEPENQMRDGLVAIMRFWPFLKLATSPPAGTVTLIPAGSYLYLEQHFTLLGREQKLTTKLEFKLAKNGNGLVRSMYKPITFGRIRIPAGASDFRVKAEQEIDEDVKVFSMGAHMHMHGKTMHVEATHPDGRKEVLLSIPHYLFKLRRTYRMDPPVVLEKGTRLTAIATYDNSETNPFRLDSTKPITFGPDPEKDEMFVVHITRFPTERKPANAR
jgi:hypothetical protein